MTKSKLPPILMEIYCREMLSFLQYVDQASPYAGPKDRPVLARVRELASMERADLEHFADWLEDNHLTLPHIGAFPTAFTNYNFVAVRKLLPELMADEQRGLMMLEHDAATIAPGEERTRIDSLAAAKRMHLNELEKLLISPY